MTPEKSILIVSIAASAAWLCVYLTILVRRRPRKPDGIWMYNANDFDQRTAQIEFEKSQILGIHWPEPPRQLHVHRCNSMQTRTAQFHEAFGVPVSRYPTMIPVERRVLRVELIAEELKELAEACGFSLEIKPDYVNDQREPDLVEIADALGDLLYVTFGAGDEFGLDLELFFSEIHRSNMSKLGADGKPIMRADGKILKGPGYFKPALDKILSNLMELGTIKTKRPEAP